MSNKNAGKPTTKSSITMWFIVSKPGRSNFLQFEIEAANRYISYDNAIGRVVELQPPLPPHCRRIVSIKNALCGCPKKKSGPSQLFAATAPIWWKEN